MYGLFLKGELKKWLRDPMMRFMLFYPLLFGIIGRYIIPAAAETANFSVEANADFILAALTMMTPLIFGAIVGFSVLDDRDDNVLDTVRVTPLHLDNFIAFRLVLVFLLSFIACIFVLWFSALATLPGGSMAVIALLASCSAPATGMLINMYAGNKIEGFAIMKLIGTFLILPVISLFFNDAKELFFAVIPVFWPAKMISAVIRGEGATFLNYNLYLVAGLFYAAALNLLFFRRFMRKISS